ncbi:MAG: hypothetical protein COX29_02025 [Candidatus Moranbacteria bacterium CG23_combo_of_CG06-09_8_20_14_all_35_22]|nr:MAG: hypothetical protein COX29_02025 [Candidatus Moranbacteria bacterium CG23_combo_of_CG06-09_8_20_14_all_35_22]
MDQISQAKIGDGLFFYVSKKGLAGYFLVASEAYKDSRHLWPDRTYPYRIKIKDVKILMRPILFSEFKGKICNKANGNPISDGASLLGKSMIPISSKDAEYLLQLMGLSCQNN